MIRAIYRCLLLLHPPLFRRQFSSEMLWIFDQAAGSLGVLALLLDGAGSLGRQWLLRSGWWKIALAIPLALVQITLGGLGMMFFGHRQFVPLASDPNVASMAEFSHYGQIAHQPLTIGILMYLAVLVLGGLVILVIGLTWWMRSFSLKRVR